VKTIFSIKPKFIFMAALLAVAMALLICPDSVSAAIPAFNKAIIGKQVGVKDNQETKDFHHKRPPQFAEGYPQVGTEQPAGSKMVEVLIKTNKSGTAYYLAAREGMQPASVSILAGKDHPGKPFVKGSISISADIDNKLLIELPEHDTAYNVYVAVKDSLGNFSRIKKVAIKTPPDKIDDNTTITSAVYTIDSRENGQKIISNVPYKTRKEEFLKALTKGHPDQEWDHSGINDPLQSGDTLTVTAPDKVTRVTYTIEVNTLPELILYDQNFNEYQVGVTISHPVDFQRITSGGAPPYTYTLAGGKLPSGVDLSDTGILSGTPTQTGKYKFVVKVFDSEGNYVANQYTMKIIPSITSFVLTGFDPVVVGDIDQTLRSIRLTVPYSADVTRLVPTIKHTGSKVTPASGQAQDFTAPVMYRVEARGDIWADYSVTVVKRPTIPVISINVSGKDGETRVRQGRTLQMIADIKPKDATDKTVTWKVIDGTGRASISSKGLLTAYSTGTVTVRAYANDGSGVVGSKTIAITRGSSGSYYWDDWYGDDWVDGNGGKIKKNGVTIIIPRNAVDSMVRISITKVSRSSVSIPKDMKLVSDVFNITKNVSGDFDRDVTIILPFDKDKADRKTDEVSLYYWNGRRWMELEGIKVDWPDETVSGKTDHFTRFAVLASEIEAKPDKPEPEQDKKPTEVLNDIYGHWAERQIRDLVSAGVINGYPDGCFRPNQTISRGEFATMIVKVLGLSSSGTKLFTDTQGHWGHYTIAAAYEAGIVSGYDTHRFGPDDPITREQMAVMIVKAAGVSNRASQLSFVDSRAISIWARSAVAQAAAQRIIMGYPDNTFRPAHPATRAEAVSIIARTPF
jgi:hypothetical protein